jgi:long-chain acyl-CoA synthetase
MLLDFMLNAFENHRAKTAFIYRDVEYSYDWILKCFQKWDERLHSAAIAAGCVVALESDFSPSSVGALLAAIQKGCIVVPLSYPLRSRDELLEIAEAEVLISLKEDEEKIYRMKRTACHELLKKLKNSSHPGLVLFSSGITGKPKGVVLDLVPLLEKFKIPGETFRAVTFLLFDHIGGFNTLMNILSNAGTIVALESRTPSDVCRVIEKFRVELLPTSPTFLNMLLVSRAYEKHDISCLKMITYGTEPMPLSTLLRLRKLYPNIRMKQTYGLSEIGIMRSKSETSDSLWIKVGGEGYETKIVENVLFIRAKTAMLGYLNAACPFDSDGWFNTQDVVEKKGEYIKFLGRESEIINVGGEKVSPVEVESVLLQMDGIKDALVRGEINALMGNIVTARVVVDEGHDYPEFMSRIKAFCRERMEKFKIPVRITLQREEFSSERFKRKRNS